MPRVHETYKSRTEILLKISISKILPVSNHNTDNNNIRKIVEHTAFYFVMEPKQ